MTDLRNVYEAILEDKVDPANFRKKIEAVDGFLVPVPNLESTHSGAGRPAKMFRRSSIRELNPPVRFRTK